MNFVNVDIIIAKNNISRYFETGQIDMVYLKGLSYDATPEMQKLFMSVISSPDSKEKQMVQKLSMLTLIFNCTIALKIIQIL